MSATLQATVREKLGSRWSRRLRLQGRIPCSIQGEGKDNLDVSIDEEAFLTARRQHEHLFDLELDKGEPETAMVRELQWDLLGDTILHVEFRRVVRGQKTQVEVELDFTGHAKGGVLNHVLTQLSILCLPSQIPDSIEVRVDDLELGVPLFAKDVVLPEGAELVTDPDAQVGVVSVVKEVVDEPAEGEEEGDGAAEPAAGDEG